MPTGPLRHAPRLKMAILDRDGVINHDSPDYIKSPEEWRPIPGSLDAIARLHNAGLRVVVATNQAGVGRGLFDLPTLMAIHAKMNAEVERAGGMLGAIFFCPHHPDDGCACRKPAPGLLLEALRRFDLEPDETVTFGDSERDLRAAQAAGIAARMVLTGNGERDAARLGLIQGDPRDAAGPGPAGDGPREAAWQPAGARGVAGAHDAVPVHRDLAASVADLLEPAR